MTMANKDNDKGRSQGGKDMGNVSGGQGGGISRQGQASPGGSQSGSGGRSGQSGQSGQGGSVGGSRGGSSGSSSGLRRGNLSQEDRRKGGEHSADLQDRDSSGRFAGTDDSDEVSGGSTSGSSGSGGPR